MDRDRSAEVNASHAEITARLRGAGCVFAEDEATLLIESARDAPRLEALVTRRIAGEPLEHLVGWAEFDGLRIGVAPGVFVPRQRSVWLVASAAEAVLAREVDRATILDLCCGSGALGAALATRLTRAGVAVKVWAADIDAASVACARANLADFDATVLEGDLFAPLPAVLRGRIDVLLCNTPYVPTAMIARMPPEARDHEPRRALDGGPDGLDVLRRVAASAPTWLAPAGLLLVEESRTQADSAATLLAGHGLTTRIATSADHDATAVLGRRDDGAG
ncbi:putative protein N(5)-glutamine methyltransferase [Nocardia takedensis]